ncbi:MAG: class I SAM-dependent methyltransferase [Clostridiales bacterium]|nr:class I SAM-dependent methyltransferase [Clostridiales bacterium]
MSDHYYTVDPTSKSSPSQTSFSYKNHLLTFQTDHGVFSKGALDTGTKILLNHLPPLQGSILDLGCGWGPIGISLAKAYPELKVTMVDINQRAVALSLANSKANHVSPTVLQGDGFSSLPSATLFQTIITNPPIRTGKQAIYTLFEQSKSFLLPEGKLYLVIRKQQGAPSAFTFLQTVFSQVLVLKKERGYWILCCIN